MKPVLPITKPTEAEKETIATLQAALAFIWDIADGPITKPTGQDKTDFDAEESGQVYGPITTKLVKEFQEHHKDLGASGMLTPPTTVVMNKLLHQKDQIRQIQGHLGR